MPKHEENWVNFPADIDDLYTLVKTDVGWVEEGPDDRLKTLVRVRVPCPPEEPDDMDAFLDSLRKFEDVLEQSVEKKIGAALVGTLLNLSYREWCYYVKDAKKAQQAIDAVAPQFPDQEFEVHNESDPEWSYYAQMLIPDDDQQRYIADMSVVEQLAENGDEAETPRPIEHLAIFPTPQARDNFAAWCAANEFSVTSAGEFDDDMEGHPVEFDHTGPATIDEIWEKTLLATRGAEEFGGVYDGWQTSIIRDGKPVEEEENNE